MHFQIGDHVRRLEDRVTVKAVVIAVNETEEYYEIEYEEGGSGWWPVECLVLDV